MSLLTAHNISKFFGERCLLENASFSIHAGEKIGFIGDNGTGKTSFLRMLSGEMPIDDGQVLTARNVQIGFLHQQEIFEDSTQTIFAEVAENFSDVLALRKQIQQLNQAITQNPTASNIEELGKLQHRYEHWEGDLIEYKIERVLTGMGIPPDRHQVSIANLSGGERTRVRLAKILLSNCDLLLLDEPTNHLDIAATEWLEKFLQTYPKAVLMVSHDRYFLDQTVDKILELENRQLRLFRGNYSIYELTKENELRTVRKQFKEQQKEIKKLNEFVQKHMAGQKVNQAKSRQKKLEKMQRVEHQAEKRDEKLQFTTEIRGGDNVFYAEKLSKQYGNKQLFSDFSYLCKRSKRVAVIGPNGCGKSTLLRIVIGQETSDAGNFRLGANIHIGYYDQDHIELDEQLSVMDTIWEMMPLAPQGEIRSYLAQFGFSGDAVFDPVSILSGGEKARLYLAKIIWQKPNFLILDEPTNHLDLRGRRALERALLNYSGTILFVSHDRFFIKKIATEILYFQQTQIHLFEEGYEAWRKFQDQEITNKENRSVAESSSASNKPEKTIKINKYRIQQAENEVTRLEEAIEAKEQAIATIHQQYADAATQNKQDVISHLMIQENELRNELQQLMDAWEISHQLLEAELAGQIISRG